MMDAATQALDAVLEPGPRQVLCLGCGHTSTHPKDCRNPNMPKFSLRLASVFVCARCGNIQGLQPNWEPTSLTQDERLRLREHPQAALIKQWHDRAVEGLWG